MMETQPMAVERKKKKPHNRWMADERRRKLRAAGGEALRIAGQVTPVFLLCFAQVMGIPSGLQAAWLCALACAGESLLWPGCGMLLALVMRLCWGIPPAWEQLLVLGLSLLAPLITYKHGSLRLIGWTAVCTAPAGVVAWATGTPAGALLGVASMAVAALSAPIMLRAVRAVKTGKPIDSMEARVAVGYTVGMMLCGGGCMMLFGVNVGMLGAAVLTVCIALFLGVAAGAITGMAGGLVLALQGLPLGVSVALSVGGFMAGMLQGLGKRSLSCAGFLLACELALLLSGSGAPGCMAAAALAGTVLACMGRHRAEALQVFFRRFLSVYAAPADAYAAQALAQWEKAVASMALAVPLPTQEEDCHDGAWWQAHLCAECPERENCTAMLGERAAKQAELVWGQRREAEETWHAALEALRGLGCARLYLLREGMEQLRQGDMAEMQQMKKAMHQRDMLVTHLTAMAGAARRFAQLSGGESWWDDRASAHLRKKLAELAYPATVNYARRVQGHVQAAFELHRVGEAPRQARELAKLTSQVLEVPMEVHKAEGERVLLGEVPLWQVESGTAAWGLAGNANGDTVYIGMLGDGRFLAAVSDGMGHGQAAQKESRQTVTLLRLCLEAGYTRAQTLTAVNGMMLLASRGERFSTVDLLTVDLWTGHAALDKLGAASSYLARGRKLVEVKGDALPLGVVEDVAEQGCSLKLKDGDELILLTDGVEDAFSKREDMQDAMLECLEERGAQAAAEALVRRAREAAPYGRKDDLSVVVLRFRRRGGKLA